MTASSPEPQTLLMVMHDIVFGRPALSAAGAGFCPTPAWSTHPMSTSSTWSLAAGTSSSTALIAYEPRTGEGTLLSRRRTCRWACSLAETMTG